MKKTIIMLFALGLMLTFVGFAQAVATDIIEYPIPEFADPANPLGNYRWYDEDWGWYHNAISGTFSSASLLISAYDVDWSASPSGEHDLIYAYDNGVKTLIGELAGNNNVWAYTTFPLGSNFFDDIAAGLQLWIDIDSTTNGNWAVSLAKSVLSIDGGAVPGAQPGARVPEPATFLLFGAGLAGVGLLKKKFMR